MCDIEREIGLRGRFRDLIPLMWHLVEPGRQYHSNWHIDVMAEHLEAVHTGEIKRLVMNVPPGSMKSLTTSVFWPTWVWIRDPGFRFIVASYDINLAIRDARRQLTIVQSDWFKERWPNKVTVAVDAAAGNFRSVQGGFRFSTSVEGKVLGQHGDCQIVDDPIKPQGLTRIALDECGDWWNGTMASRMSDPKTGRRVIIMQRLHDDDLAGLCIRTGDYEVLRLPMRFEPKTVSYTKIGSGDMRTSEGELLWPDRLPEDAVKTMEKEMGSRVAAAQLQQDPVPDGGNVFKKEWFKHWTSTPGHWDQIVQSWDCTFKKTDQSDFVCGQVWGQKGADFYLLDRVHRRMSFPETLTAIRAMTKKWPRVVTKLVEDKANGPAVMSVLEKEIPGLIAIDPEGGKEARANAVAPLFEAGNVWHPPYDAKDDKGELWVAAHELEMQRFPFGSNDDSVDTTTQALNYMFGKMTNYWANLQALAEKMKVG